MASVTELCISNFANSHCFFHGQIAFCPKFLLKNLILSQITTMPLQYLSHKLNPLLDLVSPITFSLILTSWQTLEA